MKTKTKCENGHTVTNWYDRKTRSFVVQVIDAEGNQVGEAYYSGCRESMEYDRATAIAKTMNIHLVRKQSNPTKGDRA